MSTFKHMTLLEIVEEFASMNNLIESAEDLSEKFDEEIMPHVISQYGKSDEPAINEEFSNFKDYLQSEGRLHDLQVSNYCYVGEYKTD